MIKIPKKGVSALRKTKKKEKKADSDLLCAEYGSVYRYALSLCRDEDDAQDITQETFLKAMKGIDGFDGESGLYTWLCSIAKNIWLNRLKKQGREVTLESWEFFPDEDMQIEQRAAERDSAMTVHRVLHTLSEPYKEVFSLRVFGQLGFKDISALFGKTESWARVTYHRARKMIIEKMRKDGLL